MSIVPTNPQSVLRTARGHTLRAGLVLSVLMHAGAAGVFSWVGTHNLSSSQTGGEFTQLDVFQAFRPEASPPPVPPPPPQVAQEPLPPPPPPEPDPEHTRLGIDDATEPSKTWKGAAKATEHQAPKSEVEQPALALAPGLPGPAELSASNADSPGAAAGPASSAPAVPAPASTDKAPAETHTNDPQPRPLQPDERQDQPLQPDLKQPLPQQPQPQQLQPQQPLASPPGSSPVEVGPPQADPQQPLLQQPDQRQESEPQTKPLQPQDPQQKPIQESPTPTLKQSAPSPQASPAAPQASPGAPAPTAPGANANAPDAQPGAKAEEESAAASVVESLTYRPGQPLAGKGLQVRTVNPRWGVTTMLTSSPKNTVIRITFGRSGRVLKAVFIDNGTGYPDVDGPLLDAVYRWTASGEVLKKIPPGSPKDPRDSQRGLNFDIKFILQHGATQ